MNVFKIVLCDVKEGIIKNKRNIIIPFLCFLQCLYAQINVDFYKEYYGISGKTSQLDLLTEIFHGSDPIGKNLNPDIKIVVPYLWLSIFAFAVFISFDYMHNDLTQFGIQILSRTKKRRVWWISKCIWCYSSSLWFYFLFIFFSAVFCIANGYDVFRTGNIETINVIADRSVIYEYIGIDHLSALYMLSIICTPLIVICTLNMLQMLLCLFIKPMYGYLIIIGLIIIGILTDAPIAFTRMGMVTFNNNYFNEAYDDFFGLWICIAINIICIIIGTLYFKRYDIIPDKDKE
ncbi:MAG: hypothetical protein LUG91_04170 [Ruminococcus sp.]|nr:hypothetical protein [Ruminococcus sp.]